MVMFIDMIRCELVDPHRVTADRYRRTHHRGARRVADWLPEDQLIALHDPGPCRKAMTHAGQQRSDAPAPTDGALGGLEVTVAIDDRRRRLRTSRDWCPRRGLARPCQPRGPSGAADSVSSSRSQATGGHADFQAAQSEPTDTDVP